MAFANPSASSRTILSVRDANTVAATYSYPFTIPQDAQSIVAKIWLATGWSATGSASITIQTSEDGGSTFRDVSSTTVGNSTVASQIPSQNAHFIPIAVAGATAHGIGNYVGSVAASTLVLSQTAASVIGVASGLPMLGTYGRVQVVLTGTVSTGGINCDIFAPTTDFTA